MSSNQSASFYQSLARFLGAGFPIVKAVESLLARPGHAAHRRPLETLRTGLGRGDSIAGSLRPAVPPLDFALLDASERGGKIAEGCQHLADYYELLAATRKQIAAQLGYPFVLLHLAILLPNVATLILNGWAPFMKATLVPLAVLYGAGAAAWLAGRTLVVRGQADVAVDRLLGRIPFFGSMRRWLALGRWCKAMEISLMAGRKVSEALEAGGQASQTAGLEQASRSIAKAVAQGEEVGPLVAAHRVFPADLAQSIATGEATGTLDIEAGRWARYAQGEAAAAGQRMGQWVPRIVYLVVVIFVGYKIVSFWTGYFAGIGRVLDGGEL